jgi:prepilin-type N-terminal cleavage/methylation domain-containing protein
VSRRLPAPEFARGEAWRLSGFTLVEMLVVVAIIAIMLTVGMGVMEHLLPDSRLSSAGRELASVIADARDEAIISGRRVQLQFQLGELSEDLQYFRTILDPEPGVDEDDAEEEEALRILVDWTAVGEGLEIEALLVGEEEIIDRGDYEIVIFPDGTLQGFLIHLYSHELDTYASIQVSGLLGEAEFILGKVEPETLSEESF